LYSRGWVDPAPQPVLLRKSDSTGNRTLTNRPQTRSCYVDSFTLYWGVWGSVCIDPWFLDLGTGWRYVVRFTSLLLATGAHWIGDWPGLDDTEKKYSWPYRESNSDPSVAAIPTMLPRPHTHTHTYMCVCVCVCVCERERQRERGIFRPQSSTKHAVQIAYLVFNSSQARMTR
jgi:hypothetical protein